jgi:hypothetical protein
MTRADPLEEPCAGQLACTVLQTSGGSDPFAEFNRPIAARQSCNWRFKRRSRDTSKTVRGGIFCKRMSRSAVQLKCQIYLL